MNIFWLDTKLKKAAQYHCDKHVVKMITEYVQLLSSSSRMVGLEQGFKMSHMKHPDNLWLLESVENWCILYTLTEYLYEEYKWRYDEEGRHKSFDVLKTLKIPPLPKVKYTEPPLAMPEELKSNNFITAYRNYYIRDKARFATWKYRDVPEWFNYDGILIPDRPRVRFREDELRDKFRNLEIKR